MEIGKKFKYIILGIIIVGIISVLVLYIKSDNESEMIEDISIQIEKAKEAREHDYTKMGIGMRDNIYEKYDTVKIGRYYQDNDKKKKSIDWIVLAKEEDKVLLISKYILDCKKYNDNGEECTWETCTLRKWLNEYFYNEAFNNEEKNKIIDSKLENKLETISNSENKISSGNNTEDRVFILSEEEWEKYFDNKNYYEKLTLKNTGINEDINGMLYVNAITRGTRYAYKKGLKDAIEVNNANYWLRTNIFSNMEVLLANYFGVLIWDVVDADLYGVRPAIWVKINK